MQKAVVFDLDGTILDTLEDLRDSMNQVLVTNGMPARSTQEIRSFVGNGLRNLTARSVVDGTDEETIDKMYAQMMTWYRAHSSIKTKPYEDINKILLKLKEDGYKLSVVSNKADLAVQDLCKKFYPDIFDCAMGARDGVSIKPAPDLVWMALDQLGVEKENAIYVGDSNVDVATAANAGLPCLCVLWGFRDRYQIEKAGGKIFVDSTANLYSSIVNMF